MCMQLVHLTKHQIGLITNYFLHIRIDTFCLSMLTPSKCTTLSFLFFKIELTCHSVESYVWIKASLKWHCSQGCALLPPPYCKMVTHSMFVCCQTLLLFDFHSWSHTLISTLLFFVFALNTFLNLTFPLHCQIESVELKALCLKKSLFCQVVRLLQKRPFVVNCCNYFTCCYIFAFNCLTLKANWTLASNWRLDFCFVFSKN